MAFVRVFIFLGLGLAATLFFAGENIAQFFTVQNRSLPLSEMILPNTQSMPPPVLPAALPESIPKAVPEAMPKALPKATPKQKEQDVLTPLSLSEAAPMAAPGPLRTAIPAIQDQIKLTREGVLKWTNEERGRAGMGALAGHALLNDAAEVKILDMFRRQYFEHISPIGEGASDLAIRLGYEYILIGENLALGDYEDDARLVAAWMASPGHRANILRKRYTEIGIAVQKGIFEGRSTWLAVQIFALPSDACPLPEKELEKAIPENQALVKALAQELDTRAQELEILASANREEYNEKVPAYNELVLRYNDLIDMTKKSIDAYNAQIKITNSCIAGANEE